MPGPEGAEAGSLLQSSAKTLENVALPLQQAASRTIVLAKATTPGD